MAYKIRKREQNNEEVRTIVSGMQNHNPGIVHTSKKVNSAVNSTSMVDANNVYRIRQITGKAISSVHNVEQATGLSHNKESEPQIIKTAESVVYHSHKHRFRTLSRNEKKDISNVSEDIPSQSVQKTKIQQKKNTERIRSDRTTADKHTESASSPKIKTTQTASSLPKTRENCQKIRTSDTEKQKNIVQKSTVAIRTDEKAKETAVLIRQKKDADAVKQAAVKKQQQKAAQKTAEKAAKKASAGAAGAAAKESIGSGGIAILIGLLLLILVAFISVFICILGSQAEEEERKRQNAANATASVSEFVLQYEELITQYANENGIGRYVALIEAIMMQESGGQGVNVMQVNFGTVNTVEDSIRMGVGYVRTCLELARVTDPNDIDRIKVALQGYNYGTGYISWVWNNYGGEYTPENAQLFSDNQKAALGWSIYGDPQYVEHVLRYYSCGETNVEFITDGAQFAWPVPGHTNITSGFGSRWGTTHKGIDISDGSIAGVPVVASRTGTVTRADNACTHNYPKDTSCGCGGGYGNRVEISHGDGTSTLYGHMVTITVSVGQTVQQGQVIGYVGCTGHSTGFHLHFEIKQNGTQVDPMPYL